MQSFVVLGLSLLLLLGLTGARAEDADFFEDADSLDMRVDSPAEDQMEEISSVEKRGLLGFRFCAQKNNEMTNAGHCEKAMDGNTNQRWGGNSCTHTKAGRNNWWTGYLAQESAITSVTVYNRLDCCSSRLNHFVIEVDGKKCAQYHSGSAFSVKTFSCRAVGSAITIRSKNGQYLTLCEVRVHGRPVSSVKTTQLQFRRCAQKSNEMTNAGHCNKAMDGNINQQWGGNSCTHTKRSASNWWTGYLAKKYEVKGVTLYNRLDCCSNRLNNFVIEVDGKKCAEYHSSVAFSVKTFQCGAVGSRVTIRTRGGLYLTLCEVKVYGSPVSSKYKSYGCFDPRSELTELYGFQEAGMTLKKCNSGCSSIMGHYMFVKGNHCYCTQQMLHKRASSCGSGHVRLYAVKY